MRILIFGDIVGRPGVQTLCRKLGPLCELHDADIVIANAENAANGSGITHELARQLFEAGCDLLTLGDHAFRKRQAKALISNDTRIIRPINLPSQAWGRGAALLEKNNLPPVALCVVLGRVFMHSLQADNPFEAADRWLESQPADAVTLMEIHAETGSEKQALGWHLNRRVTAVYGTHTHIPTADARLLPATCKNAPAKTTAYISDIGMCGPHHSVLGRGIHQAVRHMTTQLPTHLDVAEGPVTLQGIRLTVDPATGACTDITQVTDQDDLCDN